MKFITSCHRHCHGITLVEVVVSLAITGLSIGGIIQGYVLASKMIDVCTLSTAAQASAANRFEHTLTAQWKPQNKIDNLIPANFPTSTEYLAGQNVLATNVVTITSYTNVAPLRIVQVDCIWSTQGRLFTNTLKAFRAPNF